MKVWTAHARSDQARSDRPPILVREGFSLWAAIFGPFWLVAHRAWLPALLLFCVEFAAGQAVRGGPSLLIGLGCAWLSGLFGNDLRRWALARRGFALCHVVAARDSDAAFARLLTEAPDLVSASAA